MFCSKILVAYDGSEIGDKALELAAELAKMDKSLEINVIHAVDIRPVYVEYAINVLVERIEEATLQGEKLMKQAENILSTLPNKSSTEAIVGRADLVILEQAKKLGCDMIVIGSRGLSGLKELFLGSVSHYVSQHSPVPVLIVK